MVPIEEAAPGVPGESSAQRQEQVKGDGALLGNCSPELEMGESYLWGWGKNRGLPAFYVLFKGEMASSAQFSHSHRAGMCYGKVLQIFFPCGLL